MCAVGRHGVSIEAREGVDKGNWRVGPGVCEGPGSNGSVERGDSSNPAGLVVGRAQGNQGHQKKVDIGVLGAHLVEEGRVVADDLSSGAVGFDVVGAEMHNDDLGICCVKKLGKLVVDDVLLGEAAGVALVVLVEVDDLAVELTFVGASLSANHVVVGHASVAELLLDIGAPAPLWKVRIMSCDVGEKLEGVMCHHLRLQQCWLQTASP